MLKQLYLPLIVLFLALTSHKCLVSSDDAAGIATGGNRYNAQQHAQHSQQHAQHAQQQQQQHLHHQQQQQSTHGGGQGRPPAPASHHHAQSAVIIGDAGGGGGGARLPAPHALYHPASGSGHAVDNRNSYNLLSEAMSQAVSNEFSSLGSGSADGACHADDLDCYSGNVADRLGMEAIRTLHRQLDDDDNGNIDLSESDDFLREELKYDSGYEKRQKAFHFNDDMHISVKELWEAWLRSEVHNWTIEQTTDWLAQSVQLPQYVDLFKLHKVTGAALPRLAVNNMHYVGNVLGIKDPIHKQKIALKAMDVVLFGPPRETGTRWKDYILVTLLLSAIIGCWYAYQQNKNAKRHLRRMAQDMEGLQRAEQSLQEMQKELERARMEQENVATEKMDLERRLKEAPSLTASSSDLEVQQLKKEIEMLRSELSRAEIELVDNCWTPPPQLQSWLQYTYELESKNHLKKRVSAEKQLQTAREACEKLRKKRTSLVGAFVSTHGKSIDDVDRSIVEARNSLSEVTNELQERLHRWKQIESCLGLNIVNNNGLPYLESVLYGRNGGIVSGKGSRGRMTNSTDDLDDESIQGMIDSYSRSSVSSSLGGGGGGSSSGINSNHNNSNNSNAMRDDSSCSDDGADSQSVQFYLGSTPSVPATMPATPSSPISPLSPAVATSARGLLPLDGYNHVGNNLPATVVAVTAAAAATSTPPPPSLVSATPPPLPPHTNAHAGAYPLNDSVVVRDESRHSPSLSSERSIPVPPRSKKLQALPPAVPPLSPPPPPSVPLGRAPLPPPRKSTQSQMLRSQSADLVPMEIYNYLARQQQHLQQQHLQEHQHHASKSGCIVGQQQQLQPQQQQQHLVTGAGGAGLGVGTGSAVNSAGGGVSKKMVKQHSTASQQSTSSTSSSIQSAPPANAEYSGNGGGHSPGRWSSSERITPMHEQHHHMHQQQQPHNQHYYHYAGDQEPLLQQPHYGAAVAAAATQPQLSASLSLQSLCGKLQFGGGSGAAATTSHGNTKIDGDGQQQLQGCSAADTAAADSASLDGSLKKRKRRLRFSFGVGSKKDSVKSGKHP